MGISAELIPGSWLWISDGVFAALVSLSLWRVEWRQLVRQPALQHLTFGSIVFLAGLWKLRAGLAPGLYIHFLGLTALMLAAGWPLAMLIAACALLATSILNHESLWVLPLNALLACALPIGVSYLVYRFERRMQFKLFFAYIFVNAFFGAALAIVITLLVTAGLLWIAGAYEFQDLADQFLNYLPLVAFPEGVINGMLITGLMVFSPQLLKTLDEKRYLRRK